MLVWRGRKEGSVVGRAGRTGKGQAEGLASSARKLPQGLEQGRLTLCPVGSHAALAVAWGGCRQLTERRSWVRMLQSPQKLSWWWQ